MTVLLLYISVCNGHHEKSDRLTGRLILFSALKKCPLKMFKTCPFELYKYPQWLNTKCAPFWCCSIPGMFLCMLSLKFLLFWNFIVWPWQCTQHSWTWTPRITRARGAYYIKFIHYYNGIRRLGWGFITLTPCVPRYGTILVSFTTMYGGGTMLVPILLLLKWKVYV